MKNINISQQIEGLRGKHGLSKYGLDLSKTVDWKDGIIGSSSDIEKSIHINLWRLSFLVFVLIIAALTIVGRLFFLQVVKGREYYVLSQQNHFFERSMVPDRGIIYDRNKKVLARNIPIYSLGVVYSEIPSSRREEFVDEIAKKLGSNKDEIDEEIALAEQQPTNQVIIKRNISHDQQLALQSLIEDMPGVFFVRDVLRSYPEGEVVSSILGYTGLPNDSEKDDRYIEGSYVGKTGIEKQYEALLKGKPGRLIVEVDAVGNNFNESSLEEPIAGRDIQLTIDLDVQKKLRELIEEAIKSYQAKAGTAIIMDPKNGEVLAMVNSPTYDNNIFNKEDDKAINQVLNDPRALLVNQSVSGMYAPGSTVKMAIGAYALEKGVVKNSTLISGDPQVIKIGGYEFPDWTYSWGRAPYGMMDLPKAIAVSSDTFFYKIGGGFPPECKVANIPCQINGLGVDGVVNALRLFGFGQTTNIDLPSEAAGLVPDPDWKESMKNEPWFLGNTYHLSIGQGDLLATPLQVINLSNIVATNSKTSIPHLVFDADLVEKYKLNQGKDKPVSLESIRVAREGMDEAVNGEGIVYSLRGGKVKVAAKTGTAEFGELNAKGEYATHAWVTGFAPVDNPTISFVFMLDTGGKSSNAADVARKFIDWFYSRS